MDNTATPVICQPIKHGAAISMLSTTKYVGGHGTSIGGVIVDGGNFDWEKHGDRFPMLTMPDPSYHGAVWTEAVKPLGPIAYIIKARVTLLRDIGASMSPFNAFLFIQGLETLPLRMREHCRNADAVAAYLAKHKKITKVIYPSMLGARAKSRADTYLGGRYGALVGFELDGGREAGRRFIEALKMFYHVANIGDARSLAIHPATTTHSQLSPQEQAQTGVTDNYVRLSIGLELYRRHHRRSRPGARAGIAVHFLSARHCEEIQACPVASIHATRTNSPAAHCGRATSFRKVIEWRRRNWIRKRRASD